MTNTTLTPERIAELREIAEAAARGPVSARDIGDILDAFPGVCDIALAGLKAGEDVHRALDRVRRALHESTAWGMSSNAARNYAQLMDNVLAAITITPKEQPK